MHRSTVPMLFRLLPKERAGRAVLQEQVLRLNAPPVVEVCSCLHDAVWDMQDAFIWSEKQRRRDRRPAGSVRHPPG